MEYGVGGGLDSEAYKWALYELLIYLMLVSVASR